MIGAVMKDPRFWGAVVRELVPIAKEIGKDAALELVRTLARDPDKKGATNAVMRTLLMRSYRP